MTDVLGFITPCDVCGRKAITAIPLDRYVCPACAEFGGFGDVDVDAAEIPPRGPADDLPAGHFAGADPYRRPMSMATPDDDYPICKVQG